MRITKITGAALSAVIALGMAGAPAQSIVPIADTAITADAEETITEKDLELTVIAEDTEGNKKKVASSKFRDKYYDDQVYISTEDLSRVILELSLPDISGDYHVKFDGDFFVSMENEDGISGAKNWWQPTDDGRYVHLTDEEPVYTMIYEHDPSWNVVKYGFSLYDIVGFEVLSYTPSAKVDISESKIKTANKTYTGKALKPAPKVTLGGKTLTKGTDYKVAYKNNKNCGKATVTVTGMGKYTGTKTASFIIKPKKVAVKKLTSPKTKTVKLTWAKAKGGVTGYKVQLALDKKFKKSPKTYTVKKAASAAKTVKGLRKGKTYYARVCAYKTVGKTTYKGSWSAVKKVKCK